MQTVQRDAAPPGMVGAAGIRFDFNEGARVLLPPRLSGTWRVRLTDLQTGNVLYDARIASGLVSSTKKWFVRFRIEVWDDKDAVLDHWFDARDRHVLVRFHIGTLGDTVAWFPYVAEFARVHGCRLTCLMSSLVVPLFQEAYPHIRFITEDEVSGPAFYATYRVMMFFGDEQRDWNTSEGRSLSLQQNAAYLLGIDPSERRPVLAGSEEPSPLAEPYVCIATQSTGQAKYWNYPGGWDAAVDFLIGLGLRVVCIDQRPVVERGGVKNAMPRKAEDQTGDRPLTERLRWLRHASVFIGLSSGLSWLAWAAGCPVVLISGFTHPMNEFATPYRVINWHTCNSCWNDPTTRFNGADFFWCPRQQGTSRIFECSRLITPQHVISAILRVPAIASIARQSGLTRQADTLRTAGLEGAGPKPPSLEPG